MLEDFSVPLTTKIKDLSKGRRAKVALSLAISHDPELLILDEPTSGPDAIVRRQFLKSMVDRAIRLNDCEPIVSSMLRPKQHLSILIAIPRRLALQKSSD